MASSDQKFHIRRASHQVISGVLNQYCYAGMGVNYDPANPDNLVQADGVKGYLIENDVIDASLINTVEQHMFPDRITPYIPFPKGSVMSAREVLEIVVDGVAELMVLEGTGALDDETTAGTEISYSDGRLYEAQEGDEVAFIVRGQEDPIHEDSTFALLLEAKL